MPTAKQVAIVGLAYQRGEPPLYRAVVVYLHVGREAQRFDTGRIAEDWAAALAYARATECPIFFSGTCEQFVREGGWLPGYVPGTVQDDACRAAAPDIVKGAFLVEVGA
jgi:hypothetical protein